MVNETVAADLREMKESILSSLEEIKKEAETDLEIDDIDIDKSVIQTPKIFNKYNTLFVDHTMNLKNLYSFKEKVKLERWKYWNGKQTDKYYAENGLVHEKILKGDIDKYLAADDKLILVNEVVTAQKALVDFLERCIKEIGNRNFHIRACIDWRKFTSGGM